MKWPMSHWGIKQGAYQNFLCYIENKIIYALDALLVVYYSLVHSHLKYYMMLVISCTKTGNSMNIKYISEFYLRRFSKYIKYYIYLVFIYTGVYLLLVPIYTNLVHFLLSIISKLDIRHPQTSLLSFILSY